MQLVKLGLQLSDGSFRAPVWSMFSVWSSGLLVLVVLGWPLVGLCCLVPVEGLVGGQPFCSLIFIFDLLSQVMDFCMDVLYIFTQVTLLAPQLESDIILDFIHSFFEFSDNIFLTGVQFCLCERCGCLLKVYF